MIKRLFIILLTAISLCMAKADTVSEPLFAYEPFVVDGLHRKYLDADYGKYAYAPSTVFYKGVYHQFYCSNGQVSDKYFNLSNNLYLHLSWDHIRYRTSKDGVNWSAPRVVMTIHHNGYGRCACDPSIVHGDDGYWYMLYTGNVPGYETVVFLARSFFIQGPYFKYTDENSWENDNGMTGNPKIMLGEKKPKGYGVGQQTVVRIPNENGKKGSFRVWFRDGDGLFRYASVLKLTDLKMENTKKYKEATYYDKEGKQHRFKDENYVIGEVRLNKDKSKSGQPYYEMWCPLGYFGYETYISKFYSTNGYDWYLEDKDVLGKDGGKYRYSYIHNIGVSGDEYGRVEGGKYIVSFAAPYPSWNTDASKVLNACVDVDYKKEMKPHGIACSYELTKNWGFNIVDHRDNGKDMGGQWSMWQVLVGSEWNTEDSISYSPDGLKFPEDKNISESAVIKYFTGDFDGDGVSDLGAVDKSSHKWYLYSGRRKCYMDWKGNCKSKGFGEILIKDTYDVNGSVVSDGMTDDFEIIAGDYDGDGKTDIGAVDKRLGRWYIYSSEKKRKGVYSSLAEPNYIPWGWKWGGMDASFKIVVGDYDGDGKADRAIYRAPNWFIISSLALESGVANGFYDVRAVAYFPYGWNWRSMEDYHEAVSGDFDGDGITDRAIYGALQWYTLSSRWGETPLERKYYRSDDRWFGEKMWELVVWVDLLDGGAWALVGERNPYVGDLDGDGVSDFVHVYKTKDGWVSSFYSSVFPKVLKKTWNKVKRVNAADTAILVGDFDGDYVSDMGMVDRKNRKFYVTSSRNGGADGISYKILSVPKSMLSLAKSAAEKPIEEPKAAPVISKAPSMNVAVDGKKVTVTNVEYGSKVAVFDMLGKSVLEAPAGMNAATFEVPTYGKYIVRAGAQSRVIMVK